MKKLTLNQSWKLCLAQWKWIIEQLDAGSKEGVEDLKEEWLEQAGYEKDDIEQLCFFCEYSDQNADPAISYCGMCPGRQVSKPFSCTATTYNYEYKPHKFYAKLLELDKKRKAKK